MEPAIKIKNLSVVLSRSFKALNNIDLEIESGKITGFIGPSGAGKTTMVRAIVGRQKITKGSIDILGRHAGSPNLRSQLSYMTQGLAAYPDLSVEQNLKYFATMLGVKRNNINSTVDRVLQALDMSAQKKQLVAKLSGGQKQRVSLAISLLGHPKMMVLDEPTVGLDPVLRDQIWTIFRKLVASGMTIIMTSHVMDEAERCDDLILIREGRILAHDTPKDICQKTNSRNVEQSFLKLVGRIT